MQNLKELEEVEEVGKVGGKARFAWAGKGGHGMEPPRTWISMIADYITFVKFKVKRKGWIAPGVAPCVLKRPR